MGPYYSHCRPAGTLVRAAHSVLTMASRSMAWASARRIFGSASCGWCLSNTIRRWFSAGPRGGARAGGGAGGGGGGGRAPAAVFLGRRLLGGGFFKTRSGGGSARG